MYYGYLNNVLIALTSFFISVLLSYIYFVFIEKNSIKLGRKVVGAYKRMNIISHKSV